MRPCAASWVGSMDLQAAEISRVCSRGEISRVCAPPRSPENFVGLSTIFVRAYCVLFLRSARAARARTTTTHTHTTHTGTTHKHEAVDSHTRPDRLDRRHMCSGAQLKQLSIRTHHFRLPSRCTRPVPTLEIPNSALHRAGGLPCRIDTGRTLTRHRRRSRAA